MPRDYEKHFEEIVARAERSHLARISFLQEKQLKEDAEKAEKLQKQEAHRKLEEEQYKHFLEVAAETRELAKEAAVFLTCRSVVTDAIITLPTYIRKLSAKTSSVQTPRKMPIWNIEYEPSHSIFIESGPENDDSDLTGMNSHSSHTKYIPEQGLGLGINGHIYDWTGKTSLLGKGIVSIVTVPPNITLNEYHSSGYQTPLGNELAIQRGLNNLIAKKLTLPE